MGDWVKNGAVAFWGVRACSLVGRYRRFEDYYCFQLQIPFFGTERTLYTASSVTLTINCCSCHYTVRELTLRLLMSYIYMEHLFLMFLDHTQ